MKLNELLKVTERPKKRVGRGIGSGKGKTSGRGTKGMKARGSVPRGFIGGTLPLYKRLPYVRGLGNPKRSVKPLTIKVSELNVFAKGAEVNLESVIAYKLVKEDVAKRRGIKIVDSGEIEKSLKITLPISAKAKAKIEKAGGQVGE